MNVTICLPVILFEGAFNSYFRRLPVDAIMMQHTLLLETYGLQWPTPCRAEGRGRDRAVRRAFSC